MQFSPDPWGQAGRSYIPAFLKETLKDKIMNAFITNDQVRQLVSVSTHELLKVHVPSIESIIILSREILDK